MIVFCGTRAEPLMKPEITNSMCMHSFSCNGDVAKETYRAYYVTQHVPRPTTFDRLRAAPVRLVRMP